MRTKLEGKKIEYLFEGGVYKIICEKRGAFIRGRRFLEVGRLFEAIRYQDSILVKKIYNRTKLKEI